MANFVAVKRHADLLKAVAKVKQAGLSIKLDLVGSGDLLASSQRLAASLGLTNDVTFYGAIFDKAKLFEVVDRAHLFVMPSATEGMPRAMLEAMARGVPCIGSRVGGIVELLDASQTFGVGDIDCMSALIMKAEGSAAWRLKMALDGSAIAHDYTAERLSAKRIALLKHLRYRAQHGGPMSSDALTDDSRV